MSAELLANARRALLEIGTGAHSAEGAAEVAQRAIDEMEAAADDESPPMRGEVRFRLRVDERTPAHTTCRVFVNGASAGLLTMRNDEFQAFAWYIGDRDEICEVLDELAADPSRTSPLAHRAARLLGLQCQVVGGCPSCDDERAAGAEEHANYGSHG